MTRNGQNMQVLSWLKAHPLGLTQYDAAINLDVWRLAARIYDLREAGHKIETRTESDGKTARYVYGKGR